MRFSLATTLWALSSAASAATQWGFTDGSVTVAAKGGEGVTEKYESPVLYDDCHPGRSLGASI